MNQFIKKINYKFMLSSFLSIASVTAMDSAMTEQEIAAIHMKRAYAALDIVNARHEEDKCKAQSKRFDWYGCRSISSYFWETDRNDLFVEFEKSDDSQLLAVAEIELNHALANGNPYAASVLKQVYTTEKTKDKLIETLKASIQRKKEKGIKTGLDEDTRLLIEVEGGSFKNMMGLQRVEDLNVHQAIACYGYLSSDLQNSESNDALSALIRLQNNPSTWFHIASVYFSRDEHAEGLVWMERIVTQGEGVHNNVLGLLEYRAENGNLSLPIRVRAARLAYEYAQMNSKDTEITFSATLAYYKLLREAKSQGDDVAGLIINVGAALGRIAEANFQKKPNWLSQFAKMQEAEAEKSGDWSTVLDMYQRAASKGCLEALEALTNSPHFLKIMGTAGAVTFLVQHHQDQHLLNSYNQTHDPIFLVALSLMTQEGEFSQKVSDLLAGYADSYAPALDLNIHQLLKGKNLDKNEDYAKSASIYLPQDGRKEWALPTGGHNTYGYFFDSQQEAIAFQDSLVEKDKKIEQQKQEKIKEIFVQKVAIIDALSAKDQFELAQEYQLINQAAGVETFLDGYYLVLEKSAEKGFLPAVKELVESYTNGYTQKKKYIFSGK